MTVELDWRRLTAADREREYSPSSCIGGDLTPVLTEYADASERARQWCAATGRPVRSIAYGPRTSNTIDLAVPASGGPSPLLLFVHGGYWQELSKHESFFAAPDFLSRGIAFGAVDYTLAPTIALDEIVSECRAAIAHVRDGAQTLGVDADRIVIAGSSAGAHLAAMVGLASVDDGSSPAAGLVLLSGVYELEPLIGTSIDGALRLDPVAAGRNSPLRLDIVDAPPPAVVAFGENETEQFKRQSRLYADRLETAGGEVVELEVHGRNHFDIVFDLGRTDTPLGSAVRRLIGPTGETDGLD